MIPTKVVTLDPLEPKFHHLREAGEIIRAGGLVIIPTETVYGIAADGTNKKAIEKLIRIKNRPPDKPFSLHLDGREKIEEFACDIPVLAYKLMDKFWPGPLTLVLKSKDKSGTVGIRVPDNDIALKVITLARVPVVCPSANISGNIAPIDFPQAIKDLDGLVDFAIDAGATRLQSESSVVDVTTETLRILREGAVKKQDIEAIARIKNILFVCTGNSCRSVMAKGLLDKKLREKWRFDIEVFSAGIMMLSGLGATKETQGLLREEGIDVSGHRSQRLTKELVDRSDLILVMEKLHEEKILQSYPEVKNRLFLLKEFVKAKDGSLDIADPIAKSQDFYRTTFNVIKEAVERIIEII